MRDNARDREIGAHWEKQFAVLAAARGMMFTPHQLGSPEKAAAAYDRDADDQWRRWLLPDITVWSAPGEHHEIKHKDPTRKGSYGLERYRLDALVTFARETDQSVLYTIHDWRRAGAGTGAERTRNRLDDWVTADVLALAVAPDIHISYHGSSYINGQMRADIPICYWPVATFVPLATWWGKRQRQVAS